MAFLSRLVPQCLRRAVQITPTEADVYYSRPVLLSRLTRVGKRWVDSAGNTYDSTLDAAEHLAQLHMAGQLPGAQPVQWIPRTRHHKMGAAARAARRARTASKQPTGLVPPMNRAGLRLQLQLLTQLLAQINQGELTEDQAATMLAEMGTNSVAAAAGTPQTVLSAQHTPLATPTHQEARHASIQVEKHLVTHSGRD